MTRADELLALAAKLETAGEGGFILSREVINRLGYSWRGMAYWFHDDSHVWAKGTSPTVSVDDALALVPEGVGSTSLSVMLQRTWEGRGRVRLIDSLGGQNWEGEADTPALALCAAALRARAALAAIKTGAAA